MPETLTNQSRKPRVLFVDDDPIMLRLASAMLSSDFEVETCASAAQACNLILTRSFDCVITDWMMSGGEGGYVLGGVSQLPENSRPPVLVATALDPATISTRARDLGAVNVLRKPLTKGALIGAIRSAMFESAHAPQSSAEVFTRAFLSEREPSRVTKQRTANLSISRYMSEAGRRRWAGKPTLLLVDGDSNSRDVLSNFLATNFRVTAVATIPAAIKSVEKAVFDVIVTDWQVEGHSALTLLAAVTLKHPDDAMPVIVQSWEDATEVEDKAMAAGAACYLRKPLAITFLVNAIQSVIKPASQQAITPQGAGV